MINISFANTIRIRLVNEILLLPTHGFLLVRYKKLQFLHKLEHPLNEIQGSSSRKWALSQVCTMTGSSVMIFQRFNFVCLSVCLMQISDKIESLENHNWRTRHSKNLVQCSFSSLSNSLETHFFINFFWLP